MREDNHLGQYQAPPIFRNSYSHQEGPPIFTNPRVYQNNTQTRQQPQQHLNPKDVKQTLKKFNSTIQKIQSRIKNVPDNLSNQGQQQHRNQQQHIDESQKQADLRGSCPNIYKKIEQFKLRNTTHMNNSTRLNYDGQKIDYQPNQFSKHVSQQQLYKNTDKNHLQHPYWQNQEQFSNVYPNFQKKCQSNIVSTNLNMSMDNQQNFKHSFCPSNSSFPNNSNVQVFKSLNQIVAEKQKKKLLEKTMKKEKSPVINGFEIGRTLGKGKFGQVYLGRHQSTGFIVALKKIVKSKVIEYKMVQQLKQEIKLHSALHHPNIVKFFGMFQQPEEIYLILQYMNGGTLFDYFAQKDKLTLQQTADFLRDTISALQYMHDKSIAHRDIKPQNIVLSSQKVAKLCDFGWSALVESSRKTYCGTFDYAPPQILQRKQYDQSVDLWCIGILTYELLTGKVPFQGEVRKDVMSKIINVDKTKIQFPPELPESAKDFIQKLVQKDPNQRPKCRDLLKHQFFIDYPAIATKKHKI